MKVNPAEFEAASRSAVDRDGIPPLSGPLVHRATLVPQKGVTDLILVRHGQPVRYPEDAAKEQLIDPPLSERGVRQAERVADLLSTGHIDAVYSSDLRRAVETGGAIAARYGLEVTSWPELAEFRAFTEVPEGVSVRTYVPRHLMVGMAARFEIERTWDCFPHSESSADFRARVAQSMESILAMHPGRRVVVACHGGVINAFLAHLWATKQDLLFNPAHASVNRFVARLDRRSLLALNETHHLVDTDGESLVDY